MSEAAAPAPQAAPAPAQPTPSSAFTPREAPPPAPAPSGGGAPDTSQVTPSERFELSKLSPNARVVLPIDGKDVEMSAAEATKLLARNGSANKRFEEAAAERRKHAEERAAFEQYQTDFANALSTPAALRRELADLGLSPREIARELLRMEEAEAAMTPEQRRIRELEQREEQREADAKAAEQEAHEKARTGYREAYREAFGSIMTDCGIPTDHVARDILLPTLARAAQYVQQREGRMITKAEARKVVENSMKHLSGLRQPTDEERRSAITDADYEAWQKSKREARPEAAPSAPRDERTGRFAPRDERQPAPQGERRNVNGELIVSRLGSRWGNQM